MKAFFPVGSVSVSATTSSAATILPAGTATYAGPMLRIAREISTARVFIAFGLVNATTATASSMELTSGVVEELEIPNKLIYTHFAVITDTGTCGVNVSTGPFFEIGK